MLTAYKLKQFLKAVCPCSGRLWWEYLRNVWSFIVFSCDQLFPLRPWLCCWIAPHTVHLFCPPVLSVPIIQIVQHCFPIPLPFFCYKMLLKPRAWVSSQSLPSIETLTLTKLALLLFRQCSSRFDNETLYFHVIRFKQPILNQSDSPTVTCTSASCQQFHRFCMQLIYIWIYCLQHQKCCLTPRQLLSCRSSAIQQPRICQRITKCISLKIE